MHLEQNTMTRIIALFSFIHCMTLSFAQSDAKSMVDSLQYLPAESLDCNATLYWRIIAQGDKAIPYLIDKLNDTTLSNISHKCKATKLNVAEVSYFALQQIAYFPAFVITHIQFDVFYGNGCWTFYDYFFNNTNKKQYQDLVRKWYNQNKANFYNKRIPRKKMTECQKLFSLNKYLMWKE